MHDKQVGVIYYIKSNKAKRQSIRFPKASWTAAQARGVCQRAGGSFEAAGPAAESEIANGLRLAEIKAKAARQHAAIVSESKDAPAEREEAPSEDVRESYALPAEAISESDEGDVIRNCVFLRAGMNKTGARRWDASLLRKSINLFDGNFCYIDHPDPLDRPRSLRALAARTVNPHWDEQQQALVGDIKLLDNEAANFVKTTFADKVVRESGKAGLSVLFNMTDVSIKHERINGKTIQVPTSLRGSPALDFVADPTGGGMVGSF